MKLHSGLGGGSGRQFFGALCSATPQVSGTSVPGGFEIDGNQGGSK